MSIFSIRHEHQIHGNTGLIGGTMNVLEMGQGKLIGWHDPDENRAWVLGNKSRKLVDKRINAVRFIDGE